MGTDEDIQAATLDKVKLEVRLLERQLSPRDRLGEAIKTLAGASALLGLVLTGLTWLADQRSARTVRIEERIDAALVRLAGDSEAQRLAAVATAQTFLGVDDTKDQQILTALVNSVAIEKSTVVQNAILGVVERLHGKVRRASLDRTLDAAVLNARGFYRQGELGRDVATLLASGAADGLFGSGAARQAEVPSRRSGKDVPASPPYKSDPAPAPCRRAHAGSWPRVACCGGSHPPRPGRRRVRRKRPDRRPL